MAVVSDSPAHSEAKMRSSKGDFEKDLNARTPFVQLVLDQPRTCFNSWSWNPALVQQIIPPGCRYLITGDSLVRYLAEVWTGVQTTVASFGGASAALPIKMTNFLSEDKVVTIIVLLGTNSVSRTLISPEVEKSINNDSSVEWAVKQVQSEDQCFMYSSYKPGGRFHQRTQEPKRTQVIGYKSHSAIDRPSYCQQRQHLKPIRQTKLSCQTKGEELEAIMKKMGVLNRTEPAKNWKPSGQRNTS